VWSAGVADRVHTRVLAFQAPAQFRVRPYNRAVNRCDRALYHQIHPVKLATDLSSAVISLWLLWQHRLAFALIVMCVPPILRARSSSNTVDWTTSPRRDSAGGCIA
jgi:hypothetical protein